MKQVALDFEFYQNGGDRVKVVSLATFDGLHKEVYSRDNLLTMNQPPKELQDSIAIVWFGTSEMTCYLSLGWEMPATMLDMYTVYRQLKNIDLVPTTVGNGLIDAVKHFKIISSSTSAFKDASRSLIMDNYPNYLGKQWEQILKYNAFDAEDTYRLYKVFSEIYLNEPRTVDRFAHYGEYTKIVALMEHRGIPIDKALHRTFIDNMPKFRERAYQRYSKVYDIFDCDNPTVSKKRLYKFLKSQGIKNIIGTGANHDEISLTQHTVTTVAAEDAGMSKALEKIRVAIINKDRDTLVEKQYTFPFLLIYKINKAKLSTFIHVNGLNTVWDRTKSGAFSSSKDTFKDIKKTKGLENIYKAHTTICGTVDFRSLPVGEDGRNRCLLSAFGTKTARHAWSTKKYIFALPSWSRHMISPRKGKAVVEIDYKSQEFAIAAYISRDHNMISAYESGDPYLSFGKMAGLIPAYGTKTTHFDMRQVCKAIILGLQYGMGAEKLGKSLGIDKCAAQNYITLHKRVYAQYHRFSNVAMHKAFDEGLATVLGWQIKLGDKDKERTAMNFPIQGTGGDILRAACIELHNQGATLIGTVHDAVIFECDDDENLYAEVKRLEGIMQDASKAVLG
ncbi:MAG: DNA polymerase, partial [Pseudomonadota bacterium]|nr:DNA polymerase [Pseudomonadota bacterium]